MTTKRLTPAEADALVAHLSPPERQRKIARFIEAMAIRGIPCRELFDANGRSYLAIDMDAARAVSLDLVAILTDIATFQPEPQAPLMTTEER